MDINGNTEEGYVPLHFAVMKDCYDMIVYLMQQGADVNIENNYGYTCKDLATPSSECRKLFEDFKQLKVVILGNQKVGKTTLVRRLLKFPEKSFLKKSWDTFFFKENDRTDGIEMHRWNHDKETTIHLVSYSNFHAQYLF